MYYKLLTLTFKQHQSDDYNSVYEGKKKKTDKAVIGVKRCTLNIKSLVENTIKKDGQYKQ